MELWKLELRSGYSLIEIIVSRRYVSIKMAPLSYLVSSLPDCRSTPVLLI